MHITANVFTSCCYLVLCGGVLRLSEIGANVVLMLASCLRRWSNIKTTLAVQKVSKLAADGRLCKHQSASSV